MEFKMKKIAVVFIHGLRGNSDTWVNDAGLNFSYMLSNSDENIKVNCDFHEYNYFSKLTEFMNGLVAKYTTNFLRKINPFKREIITKKNRSNKNIFHLASGLDTELRVKYNDHHGVILIGHSLGGLVAKQLILSRLESGQENNILGYISIATPHHGSLNAMIVSFSKNKHLKELQPLNQETMDLDKNWMKLKTSHPDSLYLVSLDDEVVQPHCAIPTDIDPKLCYQFNDEDHTSICKPEDINKSNFILIKNFIRDKVVTMEEVDSKRVNKTQELSSYEKEIFVIKLIIAEVSEVLIDSSKESFFKAEIACRMHRSDAKLLHEIYDKIKFIYQQEYYKLQKGEVSSSDLVYEVHKIIKNSDETALKLALKNFTFIEKVGMLHQLANKKDKKVFWGMTDISEDYYERE